MKRDPSRFWPLAVSAAGLTVGYTVSQTINAESVTLSMVVIAAAAVAWSLLAAFLAFRLSRADWLINALLGDLDKVQKQRDALRALVDDAPETSKDIAAMADVAERLKRAGALPDDFVVSAKMIREGRVALVAWC